MPAKFTTGDHVEHPASDCGKFPKGCGTITEVMEWATGGGTSYKVKCDKTGKELPAIFKEDELCPA